MQEEQQDGNIYRIHPNSAQDCIRQAKRLVTAAEVIIKTEEVL